MASKRSPVSKTTSTTALTLLLGCSVILAFIPFKVLGASVEVLSTTCKYEDAKGKEAWMTCPLGDSKAGRPLPKTFDEFQSNLAADPAEQKFCCGEPSTRFCCTLKEKLKESPNFQVAATIPSSDPPPSPALFSLGFWSWLLLSAMMVLLISLILYFTGCILVEVIDLITYLICCGFLRRRKADNNKQYRGDSGNGSRRPEKVALVRVSSPTSYIATPKRDTSYEAINGSTYPASAPGQPTLVYQSSSYNSNQMLPPPYEKVEKL